MQYQLTKENYEKLSEELQKEYTLESEVATLKIEGENAPTAEAVKRAEDKRRIEQQHREKAEKERDEAETRSKKLQKDLENAGGNKEEIEKIRNDYNEKIKKIEQEREAEKVAAEQKADADLIKETASTFANENFTIPNLMVGPFSNRLTVETVDGKKVIRTKNADGSPSVLSLNELKREFLDNKDYSSIIKAETGSGGGATPPASGGGATQKSLSEMTATERAQLERNEPEKFAALNAANN